MSTPRPTPHGSPKTATPTPDPGAEALLHLRPQLTLAAQHPLCPAALKIALPLLDAVLISMHRVQADQHRQLQALRAELSTIGA